MANKKHQNLIDTLNGIYKLFREYELYDRDIFLSVENATKHLGRRPFRDVYNEPPTAENIEDQKQFLNLVEVLHEIASFAGSFHEEDSDTSKYTYYAFSPKDTSNKLYALMFYSNSWDDGEDDVSGVYEVAAKTVVHYETIGENLFVNDDEDENE